MSEYDPFTFNYISTRKVPQYAEEDMALQERIYLALYFWYLIYILVF
jgi:hypothetical protein